MAGEFVMNGKEYTSGDVSEDHPVAFRLGQAGTIVVKGEQSVTAGVNKIVIEALNPEAGVVKLSVEDNV